jgi:outer membrane lipoprotein SlyB
MIRTLCLVGLALGVAGCAPARTDAVRAEPALVPAGGGVIVSMRPMTVAASNAILVALNEGSAARGARPAAAVEFIVRVDGGRTVSVVQPDAGNFRPGQRVVLTGGTRTRVAAAG